MSRARGGEEGGVGSRKGGGEMRESKTGGGRWRREEVKRDLYRNQCRSEEAKRFFFALKRRKKTLGPTSFYVTY